MSEFEKKVILSVVDKLAASKAISIEASDEVRDRLNKEDGEGIQK